MKKTCEKWDVAVIGAGAAGMMCAAIAGQRGQRVVLIDHARVLGEKIRISGGGRCNFTNLHTTWQQYVSDNPHFCRSALSRYTPQDFISLIKRYGISYHEKHKGQLFCDDSAEEIIAMLRAECDAGQVAWRMPCTVAQIEKTRMEGQDYFQVMTSAGTLLAKNVVMATGGLSIPKIGATDMGYRIAKQFGVPVVPTRPGLVPLTFDPAQWQGFSALAGVAMEADIAVENGQGKKKSRQVFREDLLFTHRGLSGPGILQISSYWQPGQALQMDLLPDQDIFSALQEARASSRKNMGNTLASYLPTRVAEQWLHFLHIDPTQSIANCSDKVFRHIADAVHHWEVLPMGSEGYRKAEVTCGGVDTRALSQQTMEVMAVPGLYFIGETVDVTGWLGGYNFQWAWASGAAAGQAVG